MIITVVRMIAMSPIIIIVIIMIAMSPIIIVVIIALAARAAPEQGAAFFGDPRRGAARQRKGRLAGGAKVRVAYTKITPTLPGKVLNSLSAPVCLARLGGLVGGWMRSTAEHTSAPARNMLCGYCISLGIFILNLLHLRMYDLVVKGRAAQNI